MKIPLQQYNSNEVECPHCEFNYNHIKGFKHFSKDEIQINIQCENGHNWNICFRFSEGNLYLFAN